ncbi:hypothetical protein [Streptomyces sp. NPDC005955]|uniref:hypothetical protein n=1 Tax=Streptomyces sp. NPDC005955 TaxID=3364738 RepID=UPI00369CEBB6
MPHQRDDGRHQAAGRAAPISARRCRTNSTGTSGARRRGTTTGSAELTRTYLGVLAGTRSAEELVGVEPGVPVPGDTPTVGRAATR